MADHAHPAVCVVQHGAVADGLLDQWPAHLRACVSASKTEVSNMEKSP